MSDKPLKVQQLIEALELLQEADKAKRDKSDFGVTPHSINWSYLIDSLKELEDV